MNEMRFRWADFGLLIAILALAGGSRAWYLVVATDNGQESAPIQVQGILPRPDYPPDTVRRGQNPPGDLDALVHNLVESNKFVSLAPLANQEEETAHRAPGYPWLFALVSRWLDNPDTIMRWLQCGLGTLTAGCYFFFARRAFRSNLVGFLAGLFTALHPFWIFNTAELSDGVLTTFLLGAIMALGTRAGQEGGAVTSLLYGLFLAGLAMVRAALLPFATVALLWFLLRCRKIKRGWFFALVAFLGFGNGLAPWLVRNFQVFGMPVPVADSALMHLWIGNNPRADGGYLTETKLREALTQARLKELLDESDQARRYNMLGSDLLHEIHHNPGGTLIRRIWAGLYFVFGETWFKNNKFSHPVDTAMLFSRRDLPTWLIDFGPGLLPGIFLAMMTFGLLGWRWTHGWRKHCRLATLAAIWVPLPYILGHAETLSGPRLPLDGVTLTFAAFALVCLIPGLGRPLVKGAAALEARKES